VTGGPGGEVLTVGKSVIGGAVTGVADPEATGKTEDGDLVAGLADTAADGDPPCAELVPQAARPAAKLAAIITVKTWPRVVRRMPI
jgi:hypothetical protein